MTQESGGGVIRVMVGGSEVIGGQNLHAGVPRHLGSGFLATTRSRRLLGRGGRVQDINMGVSKGCQESQRGPQAPSLASSGDLQAGRAGRGP